jgi:hypothetical protein
MESTSRLKLTNCWRVSGRIKSWPLTYWRLDQVNIASMASHAGGTIVLYAGLDALLPHCHLYSGEKLDLLLEYIYWLPGNVNRKTITTQHQEAISTTESIILGYYRRRSTNIFHQTKMPECTDLICACLSQVLYWVCLCSMKETQN